MRHLSFLALSLCVFASSSSESLAKSQQPQQQNRKAEQQKKQNTQQPADEIKFDGEAWRNSTDRSKMVNSLIRSKLLIGKNQKQVEELLGPADHLETNLKTFTSLSYTLRNSHYESAHGKNIVYSLSVDIHGGEVVKVSLSEHKSRAFTQDGPSLSDKYKND